MKRIRANSYLVMDFETSGLINTAVKKENPSWETHPHSQHFAITEFAGIALKGSDLSEITRYEDLIKPYDESLVYSNEAAQLTQINKELTQERGVSINQFMDDFTVLCKEANEYAGIYHKVVLVGHNLGFDVDFLCNVANRCGVDLSKLVDGHINFKGDFQPRYIDTERMSVNLWGDNPIMKSFNLTACCDKIGIDVTHAHRAMADVKVNTELFRYLTRRIRTGAVDNLQSEEETKKARLKFKM